MSAAAAHRLVVCALGGAAALAPPGSAAGANPYEAVVRPEPARKELVEQALDAEEVRRVAGAQNDPIRAVQNLAGLSRPSFVSGALIAWGATPTDTRAYVDGVPIPRVYHFGALRSVINAEFLAGLRFVPGGYGADYGRALGGVLLINTLRPRPTGPTGLASLHGSATLDLIDGSVSLRGAITPRLEVAGAARVSWIGALLPLFTGGGPRLSPFYFDAQLALRYHPTAKDELDLLILTSGDTVHTIVEASDPLDSVDLQSHLYFLRARLRWLRRLGGGATLLVMPSAGVDRFRLDTGDKGFGGYQLQSDSRTLVYNLRAEYTQHLRLGAARTLELAAGLDLEGQSIRADTLAPLTAPGSADRNPGAVVPGGDAVRDAAGPIGGILSDGLSAAYYSGAVRRQLALEVLQIAPYLLGQLALWDGRLQVAPGLRLGTYAVRAGPDEPLRADAALEPRLSVRGELWRQRLWLKASAGLYRQLPQADELSAAPGTGNPLLRPQLGATYALSLELLPWPARPGLQVQLTGFARDLRDLVVPTPPEPPGSGAQRGGAPRFVNEGQGRVYGGDVLVRLARGRGLSGWVAYTLSRSERRDGLTAPYRPSRYDQTHVLTVVAAYRLPRGFDVSLRFRYVTGNPTTQVVGAARDVLGGEYRPLAGPPYGQRLPDFHQLDLRVDKTFVLRRFQLAVFLDLQNAYNRRNSDSVVYGGYQLSQSQLVAGLPIFPDLGVRADF